MFINSSHWDLIFFGEILVSLLTPTLLWSIQYLVFPVFSLKCHIYQTNLSLQFIVFSALQLCPKFSAIKIIHTPAALCEALLRKERDVLFWQNCHLSHKGSGTHCWDVSNSPRQGSASAERGAFMAKLKAMETCMGCERSFSSSYASNDCKSLPVLLWFEQADPRQGEQEILNHRGLLSELKKTFSKA